MKVLLKLLLNALVIFAAAYVLPGVNVATYFTAVVVAIVLGLLNVILKPILVILTLPITILTLGLFSLVINTLIVLLASALVPGFEVISFWWALLFSLMVSLMSAFLNNLK
ncbi:MAG: hypothetical protein COY81_04435 [Candidatus Pacebacteria bacterium CG_4_10_14_0_8_um_filter_43_12]|nr:MAG: hypothetical protein COU66_00275 [Candidatus Pacebacteria bacterium CG10_big_fil_rev_8_21_14_0_10_44_11]PIY79133.1 MAG: hypothetical protein COY81_04435 [Candidatus Pacebacteria bacterium CG_4_10_14_0_8_um_filter_43_12]